MAASGPASSAVKTTETSALLAGKTEDIDAAAAANVAHYTKWFLRIYDHLVLSFVSRFIFHCPINTIQLPLFRANLGRRHLDIGVGSGYFLQHAGLSKQPGSDPSAPPTEELVLADLQNDCLVRAQGIVGGRAKCVLHNFLQPFPPKYGVFDSISLFNLLHCIPCPTEKKIEAVGRLADVLAPDGVIVGSTVMGERELHSFLSNTLIGWLNRTHVLGNLEDTRAEFEEGFRSHFEEAEVWTVGPVLLFRLRKPRAKVLKSATPAE